jgi:hypothetical protein
MGNRRAGIFRSHRRERERNGECDPAFRARDGEAKERGDRESQFRLGPLHGRGGGAVLRQQMGDRGVDAIARAGVAGRNGRGAAQSGDYQHRNVTEHFRRFGEHLSDTGGMGENCGAFFIGDWTEG